MRFQECREGDYKIYAGALESPRGEGYIAAMVVSRAHPHPGQTGVAFRDDSVACGYRWPTAEEAISYALNRAREMVRRRSEMLAC